MKFKLMYFKQSGKFYANGDYELPGEYSAKVAYDEHRQVAQMIRDGIAPGLVDGAVKSLITVVICEESFPFLIQPTEP